jgi:hypothetical protein
MSTDAPDVGDAGEDTEIRALVKRLSRPHSSGGVVVERAALLAAGSDLGAVLAWIAEHGGVPEEQAVAPVRSGLHGAPSGITGGSGNPVRFVFPASALA